MKLSGQMAGAGAGAGATSRLPVHCQCHVKEIAQRCDSDHLPRRAESDALFLNDGIVVVGSELELRASKKIITRAFHKLEARTTRRQPCQYCEVLRPIE